MPVLAGSAAYALGEAFGWHVGLSRILGRAKGFYAIIGLAMALGAGLNFSTIDPVKALFWSAVINGVVAVPSMVMMMRLPYAAPKRLALFSAVAWASARDPSRSSAQ